MARNANQWSNTNVVQFDIQKSFARDLLINVGYLGESTHHLSNNQMNVLNQVDSKYLALGALLNNSITSPAVAALSRFVKCSQAKKPTRSVAAPKLSI